jgi:hypothetical protein
MNRIRRTHAALATLAGALLALAAASPAFGPEPGGPCWTPSPTRLRGPRWIPTAATS